MNSGLTKTKTKIWKVTGLSDVEFFSDRSSFAYARHVHDGFNIDMVSAGTLEYHIGNRKYTVSAGSSVCINQYEVHSAKSVNPEPPSIKSLILTDHFMQDVASAEGIRRIEHPVHPIVRDLRVSGQIRFIHHLAERFSDAFEIESRLAETVSHILSEYSAKTVKGEKRFQEHRAVNKVRDYLIAHYHENITLQALVKLTGLNRSYLVRVFRSHLGLPPYSYLTEIRIAKARKLLSEGMSFSDVAVAIGLCDQSHLTRMFKRSTGLTPGLFVRIREHSSK